MQQEKLTSWGIYILLSIIWGSSFIVMKYSTNELSASQIAALRIFSAGIVFLPFAFFHLKFIPKNKIWVVLLTGVLGNFLPAFLFATAISNGIDSSLAAILNSLTPLCVIITGITLFQLKVQRIKIIGVIVGFAGVGLLFASKGVSFGKVTYASLVIIGTLLYGINVNIVGKYLVNINPLHAATVSLGFLTIPTAIILWQQGVSSLHIDETQVQLAVIATVMLGIVGSAIATALFYVLVKKSGGLFASLVTYGIPMVAIFWGLIYGEEITLIQTGCLLIILAGVYLANKNPSGTTDIK